MRPHVTLPALLLLNLLMLAALVACNRQPGASQDMAAGAPAPGAVAPRSTPASDPSVPAAASVVEAPAAVGGRDDKTSNPLGTLTKADESQAMPKPGQANTHSSPSLDAASAAR